jgi:nitrogen-specific signal transduction histidine kinase
MTFPRLRDTTPTFGLLGLTSNAIVLVEGSSSRRSSKRFGPRILSKAVTPVRLPPGRLKLSTRPVLIGSAPVPNTIGMVLVAAFAANDAGAPKATMVREKLFNPFFTTKPAGEGTGLGLSISHDIIVKQHGGSIEVDTQPGEFTEFRIVLPRAGTALIKAGERT